MQSNVQSVLVPNKTDKRILRALKKGFIISIDHEAHLLAAYKIFQLKPLLGVGLIGIEITHVTKNILILMMIDKIEFVQHIHIYLYTNSGELGIIGFSLLFL